VTRRDGDAGVRLIVAYKIGKAAAELALAAVLTIVVLTGGEGPIHLAATIGRHVTGAWSLDLGRLLASAATPHGVELTTAAVVGDALLTLAEGWALHRRFAWAPWVVVVSTGSLLPFEVVELVRRPRVVRALLLLVNGAIVWYLAARALRDARRHATLDAR
jgi:uncharacterized membrane protein (DUF2068 family)